MKKDYVPSTGFLYELRPTDYITGASPLDIPEVMPLADWTSFVPVGEKQYKYATFDTMSCFPYDTKVLMEDLSYKKICEIREGEYVISHTGNKRKVINTFKKSYDKEMYEVKIKGLFETILCTPEHPFLTNKGWIKAKDLNEDSLICIPTVSKLIKDTTIYEVEKNPDFLWLLGLYLAEGSIGKEEDNKEYVYPKRAVNGSGGGRGVISFTLHEDEIDFAEKIIKIGKELFNTDFNIYTKKENKAINVCGYNLFLRDLLYELAGTGSATKKINTRLMFIEPTLQLNIVRGWLDGDGTYLKYRSVSGVTISIDLMNDIYRILLRNKIKVNQTVREAFDIHKESYTLHINGTEVNKLEIDNIYNEECRKSTDRIDEEYLYQKISSILRIEKPKQKNSNNYIKNVYNLEVEIDNSYIVNNVAVHNCTTFSFLNEIETWINWHKVNNHFTPKQIETMNLLGFFADGKFNASDRFTAITSGTMPTGNYFQNVGDAVRHAGLLPETLLPFGGNNQTEYLNKALITPEMTSKALKILDILDISYEWTDVATIPNSLKQCPIWGAIPAISTHAIEVINPTQYFDSYEPYIKTLPVVQYAMKVIVKVKPEAKTWKYFKLGEFTNAQKTHTISELKPEFVDLMDKMRGECGFAWKINSGYRTIAENNQLLDSVVDSAHTTREAIDIYCIDSRKRQILLDVVRKNGINRLGIGLKFIHIDVSKTLAQNVTWIYS